MKKFSKAFTLAFIFLVIVYFAWLLSPIFSGEGTGTFQHKQIPSEYIQLKNFLFQSQTFYRVLWIPTIPKYAYYSSLNPPVPAEDFFMHYDQKALLNTFNGKNTQRMLQEASIKYVIVPYDSEKQIYLTDRKYDEKKYNDVVTLLNKIKWLKKFKKIGKIIVYEVPAPKDHFWTKTATIHYKYNNPTSYTVTVQHAIKGEHLIFSENYDPHWNAIIGGSNEVLKSVLYNGRFNSFILPKDGNYTMTILYTSQKWVDIGIWVSLGTALIIFGCMIIFVKKGDWSKK